MYPAWITRLTTSLAAGDTMRRKFKEQLDRFFQLLQQAVESGDPDWLNPLLTSWVQARTQTELESLEASLSPFLTKMMINTFEVAREVLSPEETVQVTGALLPVFAHLFSKLAQLEVEVRIVHLQEKLLIAQRELERLDRSKSNFIAVAAHELKTPLTLIEGYNSMLRELFPQSGGESHLLLLLKGIENGTRRLREIIDDMIDVSLIDNNLLQISFQPIWLNRLIEPLAKELSDALREREQTLVIEPFPGYDEMTYGDPERLYQAFRNLLSNAIKYTPNGGRITIHGRKLPGFIEVMVTDTGIGIDPENHTRIFEKFGQIENVSLHSSGKTKFKGGGPGLGLPITKGIIEAHGGTIWVESSGCDEEKCPGSTFHVLLPIRTEPPKTDQRIQEVLYAEPNTQKLIEARKL